MLDVGDWKPPAELRPLRSGHGRAWAFGSRACSDASIFSTGSDTQVSGEMFPDSGPVRVSLQLHNAKHNAVPKLPWGYTALTRLTLTSYVNVVRPHPYGG